MSKKVTPYYEKYPEWKQKWLSLPASRRDSILQDFLQRIPSDKWDIVLEDASAPACTDGCCLCDDPTQACETLTRRRTLEKEGLRDEWGRYMGDPMFGEKENPLEGHISSRTRDVNGFDFQHGHTNSPIVEDLSMPTAAQGIELHGSDYLVLSDGRHGPRKFRNKAEKVEYLIKTGHREKKSFTH